MMWASLQRMSRFPVIPARTLVLGAAAVAGAVALLPRLLSFTKGNPIICAEAGRPYRVLKQRASRSLPSQRLAQVAALPRPHATLPQWQMRNLYLSPDNLLFAAEENELLLPAGQDETVSILSMATGGAMFFATDNTAAPNQTYVGTDPGIPQLLANEQEIADDLWQQALEFDPTLPRPVVTGQFSDNAGMGELVVTGWLSTSSIALAGKSLMRINSSELGVYETVDKADWWAVAGLMPSGSWGMLARGHGALPPNYQPIGSVPLQLPVELLDGKIFVNGVRQSGHGPVEALDGPYVDLA